MKKALFWDFDGTLAYSTGSLWSNLLYTALTKLEYNIKIDKIKQHLSSKSKEEIKVVFSWHTPENSYTESIGQKWWDKLFKHFEPFYKHYMISKEDAEKSNLHIKNQILDYKNYTLYENAEMVLCKCAEMGYKNFILSNNYPELPLIIKDLGLAEYFDDYVVSANIGYEKPRIEIYQYAIKTADFPDVCYMIGDNPVADIQGGKSAGMKTILMYNDNNFDADYRCNNLSDIPLLLI